MSEVPSPLAHHFDDLTQQKEATTLGMWTFLVTEILFFGGLFAGYAQYRTLYPQAFAAASHHLDIVLGTINTAVLIASSLTMVMGVRAAQLGRRKQIVIFLLLTIVLGLVFLGIKAVEYTHKYHEGLIPGPGFALQGEERMQVRFFAFYFLMTGMHALHMVVGVVIVGMIAFFAWRGRYSPEYYGPVDVTGLYWHFVDIVWIFLFPLLYLLGRH
ncbi:MAG: cytochrome c oxidase subunit 3 family protein [Acidobacteria bacterium]|nr:MAG: cytochrome c oxidase subunit 3 family protein [Acidobacteriota bacterium]